MRTAVGVQACHVSKAPAQHMTDLELMSGGLPGREVPAGLSDQAVLMCRGIIVPQQVMLMC
jgi:hypothetical protein